MFNYNNDKNYESVNLIKWKYNLFEPDDGDEDLYTQEEIEENSDFDIECLDADREHMFYEDGVTIADIRENFDDNVADAILRDVRSGKTNGEFEDILYSQKINTDNIDEVNAYAKRIFGTIEYSKGQSGYILTDGTVIPFGDNKDHVSICILGDDMTIGKFVHLGAIRFRGNSFSLEKRPSFEQRGVLRQLIDAYSEENLYMDVFKYNGHGMYAPEVFGMTFVMPTFASVMNVLNDYFLNGLIPHTDYAVNESFVDRSLFEGAYGLDDYQYKLRKWIMGGSVGLATIIASIYATDLSNSQKNALKQDAIEIYHEKSAESDKSVNDDKTVTFQDAQKSTVIYATDFKISEKGKEHIKKHEKYMDTPYYATAEEKKKGILTIGYGHIITKEEMKKYPVGKKVSKEEIDRLFDMDVHKKEEEVRKVIRNNISDRRFWNASIYPQGMMDAMISLMFSGYGNFRASLFFSRLMACRVDKETGKIQQNDLEYTLAALKKSVIYQGGKVLGGLKTRRGEEYNMARGY